MEGENQENMKARRGEGPGKWFGQKQERGQLGVVRGGGHRRRKSLGGVDG